MSCMRAALRRGPRRSSSSRCASACGRVADMNDMTEGAQLRRVHERTFWTHDGIDLFYRHWPAVSAHSRGAIVLFHRGHEHSARIAHLVDELVLPEFDFFAWDA